MSGSRFRKPFEGLPKVDLFCCAQVLEGVTFEPAEEFSKAVVELVEGRIQR